MIKGLNLTFLVLLLSACGEKSSDDTGVENEIVLSKQEGDNFLLKPSEFSEKYKHSKDAVLIDVRTPGEVERGYIEKMIHIDYRSSEFKKKIEKLDRDKTYFVYCAAGSRSSGARKIMNDIGFEKVYDLDGGIRAWQKNDLSIVR